MSRSGYCDDVDDQWELIRYRGAVKSAIRGKRGQAFLRALRDALDAMPVKELIAGKIEVDGYTEGHWIPHRDEVVLGGDVLVNGFGDPIPMGSVCALGAVGRAQGVRTHDLNPHDTETVAGRFGIADALVREIVHENDDGSWRAETPAERWQRMRGWVETQITRDGR